MHQPDNEHDELWRLLRRARTAQASPFFSRNVLREVRSLQQARGGAFGWLKLHWRMMTASACAVAIAGVVAVQHSASAPDPLAAIAEQVAESPDYLVITELDELLASEESSVWLE